MFLNLKDSNRFFFSHIANLQHDAWWEGQGHRFDALWDGKGLFPVFLSLHCKIIRQNNQSKQLQTVMALICGMHNLVVYLFRLLTPYVTRRVKKDMLSVGKHCFEIIGQ